MRDCQALDPESRGFFAFSIKIILPIRHSVVLSIWPVHRTDTFLIHLMKRSKLISPLSLYQERPSHYRFENDLFENFEMPKVVQEQHSRKHLSTKDAASLDLDTLCMLLSEQNVETDTLLLSSNIMTTHDDWSSAAVANFGKLSIDKVAPKESFHECTGNDRQVFSAQATMTSGRYTSSCSLDDADFYQRGQE